MLAREVIVAEDDHELRSLLVEVLSDKNIRALEARDGQEAIALLKANPSVALLLTDVRMPKMDGHKLAACALEHDPDMKILMMSGYASEFPPPEVLRAREVRTLIKPFD